MMANEDDAAFIRTRRSVVFSFWCVILLGVPLWYRTTQVFRASLPNLLSTPTLRAGDLAILLDINDTNLDQVRLIAELNNEMAPLSFKLAGDYIHRESVRYTISTERANGAHARFGPQLRQLTVPYTEGGKDATTRFAKQSLRTVFSDEHQNILSIMRDKRHRDLRVLKYSPFYDVVISLMNGGGEDGISSWPIQESIASKGNRTFILALIFSGQMQPIVNEIRNVFNVSIESQIQYYADITLTPTLGSNGDHNLLATDLPAFVNSAEWNLATAVSDSKPINFLLYIPKSSARPLIIRDNLGQKAAMNSFLLPQWGGIITHNPEEGQDVLDIALLNQFTRHFAAQLLALFGLPSMPDTIDGRNLQWRLDGLMRQRLVETMSSASATLESLGKIVHQIPNMAVPQHINALSRAAICSLNDARDLMRQGRVTEALQAAKAAVKSAEQAFFDDKMVSLLYFPDEHKYGVYLPLFGPLFLPLVMALVRELKSILEKRKETRSNRETKKNQ